MGNVTVDISVNTAPLEGLGFVGQTPEEKCCGQCCIAMVLGISKQQAIKHFGKRGPTRVKDLAAALDGTVWVLGPCIKLSKPLNSPPPYPGIVRCRWTGSKVTHFMLWDGRQIRDPLRGVFDCDWNTATQPDAKERITALYPLVSMTYLRSGKPLSGRLIDVVG